MDFREFQDLLSAKVTAGVATWSFVFLFLGIVITWMVANVDMTHPFDRYPFILLNLALSMWAAIQSSIIMMGQNQQTRRDHLRDDRMEEIGLATLAMVQHLQQKQAEEDADAGG